MLFTGCSNKNEESSYNKDLSVLVGNDLEEIDGTLKIFDIGEHILIKHIHLEASEIDSIYDYQIPSIEGYTIFGISNGDYECHQLLYVNDEVVEAKATAIYSTGEYLYQNFGEVVNIENENNSTLQKI